MSAIQTPLSPEQLEILSIFNNKSMSEAEWRQLKELIAAYFASKSVELATEEWDKQGWTDEMADELLKKHLRTTYHAENQAG